MSDKVKRYGWRRQITNTSETQTCEFATAAERDGEGLCREDCGWRKYTVTRTVRAKGRPLWWAIRQLQEGRAVVDASGMPWRGMATLFDELSRRADELPDWAQSWTLAEVGS